MSFKDALAKRTGSFYTHTVKGRKGRPSEFTIRVPYKCFHTGKETMLEGHELIDQIDRWVQYGTIEPDCGEAIKEVVRNKSWCDLSKEYFVLLGATSAMGPFQLLKEL
ncbi:hypothetical protein GUITHDRAFT_105297, partial [Guillardia theta CCMP2712]